jgi:hypothetical protein
MINNKHTFIVGNGGHQHTLYGNFHITNEGYVVCKQDCLLKHETKSGSSGEHHTLTLEKGVYREGKQVEFNPFSGNITRVWD